MFATIIGNVISGVILAFVVPAIYKRRQACMDLLWLTYCYAVFRLFIRKAKEDPQMSDLLDDEIVPVKVEGWEDDIRIVKEIERQG